MNFCAGFILPVYISILPAHLYDTSECTFRCLCNHVHFHKVFEKMILILLLHWKQQQQQNLYYEKCDNAWRIKTKVLIARWQNRSTVRVRDQVILFRQRTKSLRSWSQEKAKRITENCFNDLRGPILMRIASTAFSASCCYWQLLCLLYIWSMVFSTKGTRELGNPSVAGSYWDSEAGKGVTGNFHNSTPLCLSMDFPNTRCVDH